MRTAGSNAFGQRDIVVVVVVVDEAHGLADWAETYATIGLGPDLPTWDARPAPAIDTLGDAVDYAETITAVADRRLEELRSTVELTPTGAAERDRLTDLRRELDWFLTDARDADGATTWVVDQPDGDGTTMPIEPMEPARYLRHAVRSRGRRFALPSATILDRAAFCRSVGLDPDTVALVDVAHTSPVEHRPLSSFSERIPAFRPGVNRVSVGVFLSARPVCTPNRGGMTAPMPGQSDNLGIPARLSQVSPAGAAQDADTKQHGTSESPTG